MKKVKITVIRKVHYSDLSAKYENPIEHACDVNEVTLPSLAWLALIVCLGAITFPDKQRKSLIIQVM